MWTVLFKLIAAHYVVDFNQGDWVTTHKTSKVNINGVETPNPIWFHVLFAHSMMQGFGSYLATQNVGIGVTETIAHFIIDYAKGRNWIGFHRDQALHIACKITWFLIVRSF